MNKQKWYPWLVCVATGLIMSSIVDAYSGVIGVFLTPIAQGMHAPLSIVSLFYTVLVIVMAVIIPFVSKILEKVNLRILLLTVVIVTAISAIIISNSSNLVVFFAMAAVLGVCMALGGIVIQGIVINNWFEKSRNFAFSLSAMIESVYLVVMTPFTSIMVQNLGWKHAFFILSILTLILGIPSALIIRLKPEDIGLLPLGAKSEAEVQELKAKTSSSTSSRKYTTREVLLSGAFLMAVLFTILVQFPGNITQLFPTYGTASGIGATNGALMVSISSFVGIIVVPLIGSTSDKYGVHKAFPFWLLMGIIGFGILMYATATKSVVLSLVGAGFTTCACSLFGSGQEMFARYIFQDAFEQGFAYVTSISYFAGAFIMPLLSAILEGSKSFVVVYGFCAAMTLVMIVLVLIGKKLRMDK